MRRCAASPAWPAWAWACRSTTGIGYCNFALLRKLPVKQLKVDRSLFTDIQNSADARSVVTAIVQMAHALNLRVVAEGWRPSASATRCRRWTATRCRASCSPAPCRRRS
jgi:predicted signal transduction protein with EAL and GGDEF domain